MLHVRMVVTALESKGGRLTEAEWVRKEHVDSLSQALGMLSA